MIKELAVLFECHQEEILRTIAERYRLDKGDLIKLGSFESFVYQSENLVLKITHSLRRTKEYVIGELEFVDFLAEHGVPVAAPVPSTRGHLVETIPLEDGYFLVYAFQKTPGREPTKKPTQCTFL